MVILVGVYVETELFFLNFVHLHIDHDYGCLFTVESIQTYLRGEIPIARLGLV